MHGIWQVNTSRDVLMATYTMKGFFGGFFPSRFFLSIVHGIVAYADSPGRGRVIAFVAPVTLTAKAFLLKRKSKS